MTVFDLKEFQSELVADLSEQIFSNMQRTKARRLPAFSFSAPTGSGKTIMAAETIKELISRFKQESPYHLALLWISDLLEINSQTANRIQAQMPDAFSVRILESDKMLPRQLEHSTLNFINTQKLGTDKLLTAPTDKRPYTFWDTLNNTITSLDTKLLVIVDEAHRGVSRRAGTKSKELAGNKTILDKFISGDVELGLPPTPYILGISATPRRFNQAMADADRQVIESVVRIDDVKSSGLIKNRIVMHTSEQSGDFGILARSIGKWNEVTARWQQYCADQKEPSINPALLIQVRDVGKDKSKHSNTDLGTVITSVLKNTEDFSLSNLAHCFDAGSTISVGNYDIQYVAPNRIAADTHIKVVLFKTALSTGWDCPRAEVMMSFRTATDHTSIAQLIGRMVRNPLGRAITEFEDLNDTYLYLPHFNAKQIAELVGSYEGDTPEIVPDRDVRQLTLVSDIDEDLKQLLDSIPSYIIPHRVDNDVSLLLRFATFLDRYKISDNELGRCRKELVSHLHQSLQGKMETSEFIRRYEEYANDTSISYVYRLYESEVSEDQLSTIKLSDELIDERFRRGGKLPGSCGLHWRLFDAIKDAFNDGSGKWSSSDVKVKIITLLEDEETVDEVAKLAKKLYRKLKTDYFIQYDNIESETIRDECDRILKANNQPVRKTLQLPQTIVVKVPKSAEKLPKHIYTYRNQSESKIASFNSLEDEVLRAEFDHCEFWLRNRPNQGYQSSVVIPYKQTEIEFRGMYPDFLFFRKENDKWKVDIVDPHSSHLADSYVKARGMAEYAREHGHQFGRLLLVADPEANGPRCLDFQEETTQQDLLTVVNDLPGFREYFKKNSKPYLEDGKPYGL